MTFILFILMIGGLIAFHELGHMLLAKAFHVYVKEYSIGFGPVIWKKQGKETLYSLRLIPLGGFTGMVESEEENQPDEEDENKLVIPEDRTFYGVAAWKRILILLAGPVFNLILASLIFITIFTVNGSEAVYPAAIIGQVVENSPAQQAGLEVGDQIISIDYANGDHVEINDTYDVTLNNEMHKGNYTVTVLRGDTEIKMDLVPEYNEEEQRYMIGISFAGEITYKDLTFPQAVIEGINYTFESIGLTFKSIEMLITGAIGLESVSGTVGMYTYTQEAISYGFISYLALCGSISVSLGIMNLVPIPVFDGGRILLTLIEMAIGHRLDKKVEAIVLNIGLVLVLALFVIVTISDIAKLVK